MSHGLDIIQLHANSDFYSDYAPVISFKNKYQKEIIEKYILEEVKVFFDKLQIYLDIHTAQLSYQELITEEDFRKNFDISYFYENLFHDLGERDNGRLKAKIKWGITFDEKCVPCQLGYVNPSFRGYGKPADIKKERRYGTIDINGIPVFYYIYFTLQEILDVIKT